MFSLYEISSAEPYSTEFAVRSTSSGVRRVRVISFRIDEPKGDAEEDAYLGLAARFGVSRKEAKRAYKVAADAQRAYDESAYAGANPNTLHTMGRCAARALDGARRDLARALCRR